MFGPELVATLTRIVRKHGTGAADNEIVFEAYDKWFGVVRVVALDVRFRHPGQAILLGPFLAELRTVSRLTSAALIAHPDPRLEAEGAFQELSYVLTVHLSPAAPA